jgi:RNA polymerase sigma-70 factor (ECF subfamily)
VNLSDEALLENFHTTKDLQVLASLVSRYQNRVHNMALRMVGSKEEAEEVVQETYLRVAENLGNVRRQSAFSTWIFRICQNVCMDWLRAKRRRQEMLSFNPVSVVAESDASTDSLSQYADARPNPEQELQQGEQAELVQKCLDQLPDSQKMVLILHDIEGLSYNQIAEVIDANVGTVRSRIHYARARLRELLSPYYAGTTRTAKFHP